MTEKINHPDHYGGDTVYEAIKVIEAWKLGFCLGNAIKYVARAGKKDIIVTKDSEDVMVAAVCLEDLKKARWYLDREIGNLESNLVTLMEIQSQKAFYNEKD